MRKYKILVADDDEDDYSMIYYAFKEIGSEYFIERVSDGEQLLSHLNFCDTENTRLPDLILLDINMPRVDGVKALGIIKANSKFANVPVLMYSTCGDEKVKKQCAALGANGFATKDCSNDKTNALVNAISLYLISNREMPHSPFIFNSMPLHFKN